MQIQPAQLSQVEVSFLLGPYLAPADDVVEGIHHDLFRDALFHSLLPNAFAQIQICQKISPAVAGLLVVAGQGGVGGDRDGFQGFVEFCVKFLGKAQFFVPFFDDRTGRHRAAASCA